MRNVADESIAMELGRFDAGRWVSLRRLNGDEPGVRKLSLHGYD